MDLETKLLSMVPFRLTEDQWERIPDGLKGEIRGDYNPRHMSGMFLGNKTIRLPRKTLIEGIDFEIEYSLI